MAWPFPAKKQYSLGVDIGTSSIKIAELVKSGGGIELTNYAEYKGSVDTAIHSSSVKLLSSQAADIIKEVMSEAHMEGKEVTISIPVYSGFSTVITLPKMSEAELEQAVAYEAKKYIPLPLSEVQFEWTKINNSQANQDDKTIRLLSVAVTNEFINRYYEIAKLSGLTLKYLELETFSLARSLVNREGMADAAGSFNKDGEKTKPSHKGATIIIDIGSRSTILSVIENGWPILTRSMDVSGVEFSRVLATSLGVDFNRAEELKKSKGIDAGGDLLLPLIDTVLSEARRVIDNYSQKNKSSIYEAVLSGGSAQMPGLLPYVVKSIGRETVIASPFNGIIYPESLRRTLNDIGPSFSVAVGLALREFI